MSVTYPELQEHKRRVVIEPTVEEAHEVYPETRIATENRPGGELWPRYLREAHTSDVELGRLAAAAKPKLLLLTHVIFMGAPEQEVLDGIRRGGFTGPVSFAKDLGRY